MHALVRPGHKSQILWVCLRMCYAGDGNSWKDNDAGHRARQEKPQARSREWHHALAVAATACFRAFAYRPMLVSPSDGGVQIRRATPPFHAQHKIGPDEMAACGTRREHTRETLGHDGRGQSCSEPGTRTHKRDGYHMVLVSHQF